MVHNESLSSIVRFQYMKTYLIGEAEHLITHIEVTEVNFLTTWDVIKKDMTTRDH